MFSDLKDLFARSWTAFTTERDRREPEDGVADMLASMRQEMVEARAALPLLEQEVRSATQALENERKQLSDCERRQALSEEIGDAETARIAAEWAERHRERIRVLTEKRRVAIAERDLRQREADQMAHRYREVDANRWGLVAELRRRGVTAVDELDADLSPPPDVDARLEELKRRMGRAP